MHVYPKYLLSLVASGRGHLHLISLFHPAFRQIEYYLFHPAFRPIEYYFWFSRFSCYCCCIFGLLPVCHDSVSLIVSDILSSLIVSDNILSSHISGAEIYYLHRLGTPTKRLHHNLDDVLIKCNCELKSLSHLNRILLLHPIAIVSQHSFEQKQLQPGDDNILIFWSQWWH